METLGSGIFCLGLNHRTAPLAVRERVSFDPRDLTRLMAELSSAAGLDELTMLSTCNRTEIYFCGQGHHEVAEWLLSFSELDKSVLTPHLYFCQGIEVIRHSARVASGLDSMVLGETQIVGQIKDAYRRARDLGVVGSYLSKVFDISFSICKEVRSKTEIGAHSISLASAALKIVQSIYPATADKQILFFGAGDMIRLCANHFLQTKFSRACFANRTISRATDLAERYGGSAVGLEVALDQLCEFDVLVSCTASPVPLVGKGAFERALKIRKHKPLVVFDLAVPRDIEPSVGSLDDVFLFSIDDLSDITNQNLQNREAAISAAEKIIEDGVSAFSNWLSVREAVPVLKNFREFGDELVNTEMVKSLAVKELSDDPERVIKAMSHSIKNKFLDRPSRVLNRSTGDERRRLMEALVKLFELEVKE